MYSFPRSPSTIRKHDYCLKTNISADVQTCLQEIADNPGTIRMQTWPPSPGWEQSGWNKRSEKNKIYVNGEPAYWVEISHDNSSIYDLFEPVAWLDIEPGEEVWIDNVAANPQAPVPVTGPWIVVHYHKLYSIKNNSTTSYQADNIVRKKA